MKVYGVGINYEGIVRVFASEVDALAYVADESNYVDYVEEMEVY